MCTVDSLSKRRLQIRSAPLCCGPTDTTAAAAPLPFEVRSAVSVPHFTYLIEGSELQGFVRVDGRTYVLAVIRFFHFLKMYSKINKGKKLRTERQ